MLRVKNNLRVLLAKNDMSQKEFAERNGIVEKTISLTVNQKLVRYPLPLIEAMVKEFNITDMNEIFTIIHDEDK